MAWLPKRKCFHYKTFYCTLQVAGYRQRLMHYYKKLGTEHPSIKRISPSKNYWNKVLVSRREIKIYENSCKSFFVSRLARKSTSSKRDTFQNVCNSNGPTPKNNSAVGRKKRKKEHYLVRRKNVKCIARDKVTFESYLSDLGPQTGVERFALPVYTKKS